MKKNGFTLIELIGVVAIISLVMIVSVPQIMSTLNNSSVKKTEGFKKDLEASAKTYVENNWNYIKSDIISAINGTNKYYCLTVKSLIDKGYIDKSTKDPETGTIFVPTNKYILLQRANSDESSYRFTYTYLDKNDSNDINRNKC